MDPTDAIDERLGRIRLFEQRVGLGAASAERVAGAVKYLNMGEDDLNLMTAEQLGVASVAVANLAFHLQNEYCRAAAEAKRLFGASRRLVSKAVTARPGYVGEDALLAAIAGSAEALPIDRRAQEQQHKADRLAFLAKQAEFAARLMMELATSRRRHNRGGGD